MFSWDIFGTGQRLWYSKDHTARFFGKIVLCGRVRGVDMQTKLIIGSAFVALIMGGVFLYAVERVIDTKVASPVSVAETASNEDRGAASTTSEVVLGRPAGAQSGVREDEDSDESEEEDRDKEEEDDDNTSVPTAYVKPPADPKPKPVPVVEAPTVSGGYTLASIASHNSASSCYMAIRGKVYDVTPYISKHPGGNTILKGCGKDATGMFEGVRGHLKQATLNLLPGFYLGELTG